MKAAVSALQKAHRLLDTDEKSSQSKLSFLQRKSGRSTADQAVKNSFAQDFRGLQKVVESHEAQWRSGQNKVGQDCSLETNIDGAPRSVVGSEKSARSLTNRKERSLSFRRRTCIHPPCVGVWR